MGRQQPCPGSHALFASSSHTTIRTTSKGDATHAGARTHARTPLLPAGGFWFARRRQREGVETEAHYCVDNWTRLCLMNKLATHP